MPFKNGEKQAEYMRKYRRFRKRKMIRLKKALDEGKFELAKKILEEKPSISVK